jgi:hypothetical protein
VREEPLPERARKAAKNERGEGGDVDVDCCRRGNTGAVMGDEVDNLGAGEDADEVVGVTGSEPVSVPLDEPFFFRSSSSRFVRSSSCVCKLCRIASCNIISSASSLVILTIPSTRLPIRRCSFIALCTPAVAPYGVAVLTFDPRLLCPATARACCNAVAVANLLASTLRRCANA